MRASIWQTHGREVDREGDRDTISAIDGFASEFQKGAGMVIGIARPQSIFEEGIEAIVVLIPIGVTAQI